MVDFGFFGWGQAKCEQARAWAAMDRDGECITRSQSKAMTARNAEYGSKLRNGHHM
jgi:hypothetical protein